MRIEDIIRIVDGLLQNFPSVDHIESIKIDPFKIKRGDLFIDINNSLQDQKEAVQKGAFSIISEEISEIIDEEIAWILVDSLRLTCVKLARYEFNKKNSHIIFIDDISQEILQSITKDSEFAKLSSDAHVALMTIISSGENVKYTCSDERLAFSLDPYCQKITCKCTFQILKPKSPFYASFICNDNYYHDIRIPNIFIEKLCSVISFLQNNSVQFNIHKLGLDRHFSPIFIDYGFNKKEFGQGEKVVLFESNMDNLDMEIKHLSDFSKQYTICAPKMYRNYLTHHKNIILFNNMEEIKDIISKDFRYILIFGQRDNYEKLFKKKIENDRRLF